MDVSTLCSPQTLQNKLWANRTWKRLWLSSCFVLVSWQCPLCVDPKPSTQALREPNVETASAKILLCTYVCYYMNA
eukprot:1123633-Lingulodinium_polyedra.AAC.1